MIKVKFLNIGRNDVSYDKEIETVNYENMYRAVKPYLLSSDIWFSLNDDEKGGTVFAGFRPVGQFEILSEEED